MAKLAQGLAVVTVGLAIAWSVAGEAWAQSAANVIKERQDTMDGMLKLYSPIARAVSGNSGDKEAVAKNTADMAALAAKLSRLFPAGSGPDSGIETRAKPEIWTQRTEFDAAVAKLAAETSKLADVAKSGDLSAVGTQLNEVGNACGNCHGGPRASGGKFRTEKR